jgi:RimJ/RimL family protein N-acetyltransferase
MTDYYLDVLHRDELEELLAWRNAARATLRTPFLLTKEMQEDFYVHTVCSRESRHRYFAIRARGGEDLAAVGGLTYIEWENGCAQISLLVSPDHRGEGVGDVAVELLLEEAFGNMRLLTVYGECYYCNEEGILFWEKQIKKWGALVATLPQRKFWDGQLWDACYFTFLERCWRLLRRGQEDLAAKEDEYARGRARLREQQEGKRDNTKGATSNGRYDFREDA